MKPSQKTLQSTELLILPDGRILAHNITPEMAALLAELDPQNKAMKARNRRAEFIPHDPQSAFPAVKRAE